MYVDDIVFGSTNDELSKSFGEIMRIKFEMSMMEELNFFLRLQIKQYKDGIFINQSKYTRELLKMFKIDQAKTAKTPMSTIFKLEKDEEGKSVDSKMFKGIIGSLLYLTASRPDIQFSICLCTHFQVDLKESHLLALKRIFKYLWELKT